jgi:hypothetical protein
MDVIYSSAHYWILAYPAQEGFELFDKETLSNLYLQGPLATHFRMAMDDIPAEQRTEETIDAFLDEYCSGSAHPIVFH